MKNTWLICSTGFALFSIFFGSGNLVFPITVGLDSGGHFGAAASGILLTGVVVPFLGVLGMMLHKGDIDTFFGCLGKKGIFLFSLMALSLMGPFGVLARCLTVVHGALLPLFPAVSLPLTSLVMCIIIFLLTVNKSKIIPMLGSVLTPFLLLSIAALVFFGLRSAEFPPVSSLPAWDAFKNGFFQGYQTMDLLAAFFFSKFVIAHLYAHRSSELSQADLLRIFCNASLVGAAILAVVYGALVLMGWLHAPVLLGMPPQEMLGLIAMESLGPFATPCVCLAVIFACLTTAIVLASLFADFLRVEVCAAKLKNWQALLVTLLIGFMVSNLDFAGIAGFLGPILEAVYPGLIVLTVVNIGRKFWLMAPAH